MGYRVEDRKLILDEEEAATVRRIFERYLALRSISKLQAELRLGFLGSAFRYAASVWRQTLRAFSPSSLGSLIAVWITFAIVVYVFEPLFLHANFRKLTSGDSQESLCVCTGFTQCRSCHFGVHYCCRRTGAHGALA